MANEGEPCEVGSVVNPIVALRTASIEQQSLALVVLNCLNLSAGLRRPFPDFHIEPSNSNSDNSVIAVLTLEWLQALLILSEKIARPDHTYTMRPPLILLRTHLR